MKIKKLDKAFTPYRNIFAYAEKLDDNANTFVIALDSLYNNPSKDIAEYRENAINIIDKGYCDLYKPIVIALYTLLEAAIRDLIIALFKEDKRILENVKEVQKIKVSIVEYEKMTQDEKYDYLYAEYEREIVKGEKYGLSRFKKLLQPLGINFFIDKEVEKSILELAQVRNCIIHRNSIVDSKLLKECPWLRDHYNTGDEIIIKQKHFRHYVDKVLQFSSNLEDTVFEYFTVED